MGVHRKVQPANLVLHSFDRYMPATHNRINHFPEAFRAKRTLSTSFARGYTFPFAQSSPPGPSCLDGPDLNASANAGDDPLFPEKGERGCRG